MRLFYGGWGAGLLDGGSYDPYVSLMYELKKIERYLRVNLLGPGHRLMKKESLYWAAVSQSLRNTTVHVSGSHVPIIRRIIASMRYQDSVILETSE